MENACAGQHRPECEQGGDRGEGGPYPHRDHSIFHGGKEPVQEQTKALKRLQGILVAMEQDAGDKQANQAWREHTRIVRGNPVRVYEGMDFKRK